MMLYSIAAMSCFFGGAGFFKKRVVEDKKSVFRQNCVSTGH